MSDYVKIRIAVAIDSNGTYSAAGYTKMTDADAFDYLLDNLEPGEARYYIEATLRKPIVLVAEPDSITEVTPDSGCHKQLTP